MFHPPALTTFGWSGLSEPKLSDTQSESPKNSAIIWRIAEHRSENLRHSKQGEHAIKALKGIKGVICLNCSSLKSIKETFYGIGEMARYLRGFSAILEDLRPFPFIYNHLWLQLPGIWNPFWLPQTSNTRGIYLQKQTKMHICFFKKCFIIEINAFLLEKNAEHVECGRMSLVP